MLLLRLWWSWSSRETYFTFCIGFQWQMVTSVLASIFASGKLGLGLLRELVWRHVSKNNFLQIFLRLWNLPKVFWILLIPYRSDTNFYMQEWFTGEFYYTNYHLFLQRSLEIIAWYHIMAQNLPCFSMIYGYLSKKDLGNVYQIGF